jgi:hypothetical protein
MPETTNPETTNPETTTDTTAAAEAAEPEADEQPPVVDQSLPVEMHPTVEEAEAMFKENTGLSTVVTDAGLLTRDGQLTVLSPVLAGE